MTVDEAATAALEHVPGRFRAVLDGQEVAQLDYDEREGVWDLVHTWVTPPLRGTGLSSRLVAFALDAARESGHQVRLTCPYLPHWYRRHPEYADVVRG